MLLRHLEDEVELHNTLTKDSIFSIPRHLLNIFGMRCLFNHPVNTLQRWNEYRHSIIKDLLIDNINEVRVIPYLRETMSLFL